MTLPAPHVLTALRRLRRVETDAARRDLGEALARQMALEASQAATDRELAEARRVTGDFDRQAFAAFLDRKQTERAALDDAMRTVEARIAAARDALARRRVAETTVEEALARASAAREADAARREQAMLEDAARALRAAKIPRRNQERPRAPAPGRSTSPPD